MASEGVYSPVRTSSNASISSSVYSPGPSSPGPSVSLRGAFKSSTSIASGPSKRQRLLSDASTIRLGVKSPTGRRPNLRKRTSGAAPIASSANEVDLMRLSLLPQDNDTPTSNDIDGLFVAFSTRDVRDIEENAKREADKKREDLRTMVGERYRDLLSAADSILRMRKSSGALLQGLSCVHRDCIRDSMTEKAQSYQIPKSVQASTEEISLSSPYTLATLVKLLMDCPEYIWRSLEQDDFLSAARLEGLARIIYREVVNASERQEDDAVMSAFPLIEKHWETLSGLSSQIVKRARASLSKWHTSAFHSGQTLACLVLLENSAMSKMLSLLFSRRLAALDDLLVHGKQHEVSQELAAKQFISGISLVLATLEHAHTLFEVDEGSDCNLPTILQQLSRNSAALPAPSQPINPMDALAPSQLPPILHTMPNVHHLLRYLPHSIISFTPFIDMRSSVDASILERESQTWFEQASQNIITGLTATCSTVTQAGQLALLHDAIGAFPWAASDKAIRPRMDALRKQLKICLESRLAEVVSLALTSILSQFEKELQTSLATLPSSSQDLQPTNHLFARFPTSMSRQGGSGYAQSHSINEADYLRMHEAPIVSFIEIVNKRMQGRPPVLDQCLSEVEGSSNQLANDMKRWIGANGTTSENVKQAYDEQYQKFLHGLQEVLSRIFEGCKDTVPSTLFMLRVMYGAQEKNSFVSRLSLGSDKSLACKDLKAKCIEAWKEDAIQAAVAIVDDGLVKGKPQSSPDPSITQEYSVAELSPTFYAALLVLVKAMYTLGSIQLGNSPNIHLLDAFASTVSQKIQGQLDQESSLTNAVRQQTHFDLSFLRQLSSSESDDMKAVIAKLQPEVTSSENMNEQISLQMKRMQNLLAPLLTKGVKQANSTALMPLGAPPAAGKQVNQGLALVKPGPRFALLPVSAL